MKNVLLVKDLTLRIRLLEWISRAKTECRLNRIELVRNAVVLLA